MRSFRILGQTSYGERESVVEGGWQTFDKSDYWRQRLLAEIGLVDAADERA